MSAHCSAQSALNIRRGRVCGRNHLVLIFLSLPLGGAAFGVDRLSAFFVLVIAVGAIPATLYALGYTREYVGKHSIAGLGVALNLFLAAMVLVTLARNVLTFLASGKPCPDILFLGDDRT